MTLEDTIAAAVRDAVAPLAEDVRRLTAEVERLRRALPAQLVSVTEAARVLGLDPRTIRRRVQEGAIPARRVGRKLLVDLAAVQHEPTDEEVARAGRDLS